jgi:hypothetical protein
MKTTKSILSIAVAAMILFSFNTNSFAQSVEKDELKTHATEARGDESATEIKSGHPLNDPNTAHISPFQIVDELKSTSITLRGDSHGDEIISDTFINSLETMDRDAFEKGDELSSYATTIRGDSHGDEIIQSEIMNTKDQFYPAPAHKKGDN